MVRILYHNTCVNIDQGACISYMRNAEAVGQQAKSFTVAGTGLHLNGKLTQGENIADNGGVKQAFK
ncbi:hypothetical protein KIN20_000518, partial [Parelaphostrongylus tenuis]